MLSLSLDAGFDYLRSAKSLAELEKALAGSSAVRPRIVFDHGLAESETLQRAATASAISARRGRRKFHEQPGRARLIQQHGTRLFRFHPPFDE